MNDTGYFSSDYAQARARFLNKAEELSRAYSNLKTSSFPVPSRHDSDLFVDYLELPATDRPETLLVLTSGVHGSEASTGAAIQQMFLSELLRELPRARVGLFIAHVLNPYGFKHNRRGTENNVNLNRNFAADAELFRTENPGYERVASALEPKRHAGGPVASLARAAAFSLRNLTLGGFSSEELNRALSQGQFKHPRGLEYGGHTWEPQIEDFIARLKTAMAPYTNIVIFDLHTGLGNRYELHLIPVDEPAARDEALMKKLFDPDAESHLYKVTSTDTKGFYQTFGDLNSLPPKLASAHQRTLTLTFEFGTLGNSGVRKIQTLASLLNENSGFHFGFKCESARLASQRSFTELFSPMEERWRENAIHRSRETLRRVLRRL